jgi:hypothetical protein
MTAEDFDFNKGNMCIRADHPFPPRKLGLSYFELTIEISEQESESEESEPKAPTVTIGMCGEFCNQLYAHCGWKVWSVGYHGDNGMIYEEYGSRKHDTKRTYGAGHTVGCGVNYESEKYFFTLDGEIIGTHLLHLHSISHHRDGE